MQASLQADRLRAAGVSPFRPMRPTGADPSLRWRARHWLDETEGELIERTEEVIEDRGWGWGWRAWRWR